MSCVYSFTLVAFIIVIVFVIGFVLCAVICILIIDYHYSNSK